MINLTEMDSVQLRISCGINAVDAIYTAMAEGPFQPEAFVDALFFTFVNLKKESDKMRTLIDSAFEERRKENAEKGVTA